MSRKMFVNLAVEDLDRSVDFFTKLGFSFDPRFTDENATCMLVGEDAYVMLLTKPFFDGFTNTEFADPTKHTETIVALSAAGREEVDGLAEKALAAGATPGKEPMELDFMYSRDFHDPDGHLWSLFWMDPAALEAGPVEAGTAA